LKENEGVNGKLKKEIHWESAYPFVFPKKFYLLRRFIYETRSYGYRYGFCSGGYDTEKEAFIGTQEIMVIEVIPQGNN